MINAKDQNFISEMIFQYWPEQANRAGKANVNDIIQDILIDESKNYMTPNGGHHLELGIDLNTILSAGSFIIALVDFCLREYRNHSKIESTKIEEEAKKIQPKEIDIPDEKIKSIIARIIEKIKDDFF